MSETYARGSREQTTMAGGVIIVVVSLLAALLVTAGLVYARGADARQQTAMAAAGCEPSLFVSGMPCTTEPMMASQYQAIANPVSQQLTTDMATYTADEKGDLADAEAVLRAEVMTEQSFGASLAAVTFTPQNRARANALIQNATSNGITTVPLAAVTFTPQITVIADALIQANQARASLTAEQARSTSLTQLRSFDQRVAVAGAAVQKEMNLIGQALAAPAN